MFLTSLYHDAARLYTNTQGPKLLRLIRIFFIPSFHVMCVYRLQHACISLWPPFSWVLGLLCLPLHILVKIVYAISIHPKAVIGPGAVIIHTYGIVIHPKVIIGKNITIGSSVVIGAARLGDTQYPVIGDNCFLGTGAKILGNLRVNDGTIVGANSVVLRDTQAHAIVAGNPAKTIKRLRRPSPGKNKPKGNSDTSDKNTSSSNGAPRKRSRPSRQRSQRNGRQNSSHVRMHKDTRGDVIHV